MTCSHVREGDLLTLQKITELLRLARAKPKGRLSPASRRPRTSAAKTNHQTPSPRSQATQNLPFGWESQQQEPGDRPSPPGIAKTCCQNTPAHVRKMHFQLPEPAAQRQCHRSVVAAKEDLDLRGLRQKLRIFVATNRTGRRQENKRLRQCLPPKTGPATKRQGKRSDEMPRRSKVAPRDLQIRLLQKLRDVLSSGRRDGEMSSCLLPPPTSQRHQFWLIGPNAFRQTVMNQSEFRISRVVSAAVANPTRTEHICLPFLHQIAVF